MLKSIKMEFKYLPINFKQILISFIHFSYENDET